MLAATKPVVLYKDFHKDVKDMLTKSYSNPSFWKLESKFKGPKNMVVVNPTATSDGSFSADVEYAPCPCGALLKATVTPCSDKLKLAATYQHKGHKVEAIVHKSGEYEVNHECTLNGRFSMHEKLKKSEMELGFGAAVARHCHIGCGAVYKLNGKNGCDWSASCRYAQAGRVVAIRTSKLNSYTTSFLTPIPTCPHRVLLGAEVVCGRGQGWSGTVGMEAACLAFKGNTLKARVNKNMEWAVAYIAKVADNWTAAITIDKNLKPGVLLTHS